MLVVFDDELKLFTVELAKAYIHMRLDVCHIERYLGLRFWQDAVSKHQTVLGLAEVTR